MIYCEEHILCTPMINCKQSKKKIYSGSQKWEHFQMIGAGTATLARHTAAYGPILDREQPEPCEDCPSE
jgi:hypothetical protein